jgi:hypothetical protein
MQNNEVHIEEMKLRVPGMNEKEAYNLGQEVAQRLAESLPVSFQNRYFNNLDLKLTLSSGTSRKKLTQLITDAILKRLV